MATIAIIDNDEDTRDVLSVLLETEGLTVEGFTSGKHFLETFKPQLYRLLLVDLSMPEMDGYALLKTVRQQDPSVPVIAVTAHAFNTDREKARAAGFSDFVTKPFLDLPTFFDLIIKHLSE